MKQETICILGGTGFVGRQLANRLAHYGYRVLILTRRRERHRRLIVNPNIVLLEADVHDSANLLRHFEGVEAIINLVGILNESGKKGTGFRRVHVELPEKIVAAAAASGVTRLLHMSALNADASEQNSLYLKTKGEGENLVHAAAGQQLVVTSFRPSVIFGAEDRFFNRFATLLKLSRPVFPLACPNSRFAPVYVTDVVEANANLRVALVVAAASGAVEPCAPLTATVDWANAGSTAAVGAGLELRYDPTLVVSTDAGGGTVDAGAGMISKKRSCNYC